MTRTRGLLRHFGAAACTLLRRWGWLPAPVVREAQRYSQVSHDPRRPLPRGAAAALRNDHPRLQELRRRYAALDWPVCRHTFWAPQTVARDVQLPWFRGDNAYVWQYRQLGARTRDKMRLIADYVRRRDALQLMDRLSEDGLFGCWTFEDMNGQRVSRDLLESVNEINFLERRLGIAARPGLRVVDIGAGYGRLAHRLCTALSNVARYDCLDAVPESTFLCEYYLQFRGVQNQARAISLPEVEQVLPGGRYDLAVNIHSFSECTYDGIQWWLQRLRLAAVPQLLIVPNHNEMLLSAELDGRQRDYAPLLAAAGYRLQHQELVFDDPVLQQDVGVRDYFMLYEYAQ